MTKLYGVNSLTLLFSVLSTCLVCRYVNAAAGMGLLKVVWQPICELSEELDTYAGAAIKSSSDQLKAIQNSKAAELRTGIYIAKNTGGAQTKAISLLRAYLSQKTIKAISHMTKTAMPQAIKSVAHATYLKGNLDEFLNLMVGAKGSTTTGCLVTTTPTIATKKEDTIDSVQCKRQLSEPTATQLKQTKLTHAGYPHLRNEPDGVNTNQAASTATCKILDGSTSGFAHGNAIDDTISVAGGYITIPKTSAAVTLADLTNLATTTAGKPAAFVNLFNARDGISTELPGDFKNTTGTPTARPDLLQIAKSVLLNKEEQKSKDGKAVLVGLLGGDEETQITTALKLVDDETIPEGVGGNPTEQKLSQITDENLLNTILAHYEMHLSDTIAKLRTTLAQKEAADKGAGKTPEQICNDIGDSNENKCNTTKGCIYNKTGEENKKCTLSEEGKKKADKAAKQETEGKTGATNTTASNSFVINRAPLLLAVFLF
uniref:Variant surface glycoprotein n=1 Tax=Trypanosoma brucei TaxID=5691 RepID=A0A1V0G0B8_9TRYP|nr:variant surface glycoprotein [Trypanosoma brucei]